MTDNHEQIRELLAAHALGATSADEAAAVERHLEGCPGCAGELREWSGLVARLPEAVEPVEPAAETRARVLAATAGPAAPVAPPATPRPARRWPLALAATLLAALGLLGLLRLERQEAAIAALEADRDAARGWLAAAEEELTRSRTELARLRLAMSVAGAPRGTTVRLAGLEAAPEASARTLIDPEQERAAFFAGGLAPAPEGRTYQLWQIVSGTPRSAGTFGVDAEGRALVVVEDVAPLDTIDAWAVTVEPAGGVPQPTGEMVLLG